MNSGSTAKNKALRGERDPETRDEISIASRLKQAAGSLFSVVKVWEYGERIGIDIRGVDRARIPGSPFEATVDDLRDPAILDSFARGIQVAGSAYLNSLTR